MRISIRQFYLVIFMLFVPGNTANAQPKSACIHWGTTHNTLNGVTLTWHSVTEADSIRWGYFPECEQGIFPGKRRIAFQQNTSISYWYDYQFPRLQPSSTLFYSIKCHANWGEAKTFTTASDTSSEKFSFIAGGDSQQLMERWQKMSNYIASHNIDFFILLGDAVQHGTNWQEWQNWYRYGQTLLENEIVFHTWGNHEFNETLSLNNTALPGNEKWYAFEQGNTLFICLLSEQDFEAQYHWLRHRLENTKAEWIIAYFHRPFFTRGSHAREMDPHRATWWKAFDDYGVDIVMSGHTHSYIRSLPLNLNISDRSAVPEYGSGPDQGRLQFVAGGLAGKNSRPSTEWFTASAYSGLHYIKFVVDGKTLHFDTIDEFGQVIDSLTMRANGTVYTSKRYSLPARGICAHRGASATHPENTLAAFREAIRLGAHMIEFDVRMTRDGELVLLHDETIDRTTDGTGNVAEHTLDDLRQFDAGSWKAAIFANEKIPTLSEALGMMPRNIWLNIHIKGGADIGAKVARMINKNNRQHQAIVACQSDAAQAIKNINPEIMICNMERKERTEQYVQESIAMNANFIQLTRRADLQLSHHVENLKTHQITINYYGADTPEKLRTLFTASVNFPLVDDVAAMMQIAGEFGIQPVTVEY
ncbi:metallophosphoesterase [candidate division KSB1 bacterium]|nr:metallophosphoesterase [candidate division KSB1 bacterium]